MADKWGALMVNYDQTDGDQVETGHKVKSKIDFDHTGALAVPHGDTVTVDAEGEVAVDADADGGTVMAQGELVFHDGTRKQYVVAADARPTANGQTPTYNSTSKKVVWGTASGAEPALGNPSADGYGLASTVAGVRSWVAFLTKTAADLLYATIGHLHTGTYEPANANIQAHVTGTGSPHTAAGVGADAAGTAAGAVSDHAALTTGVHGVGAGTIAKTADIPSSYSSNPANLGTAGPGDSTAWARGNHVHAMPSASDVGAEASGAVSSHAGLTTGVHGVGAGTVAKTSDIPSSYSSNAAALGVAGPGDSTAWARGNHVHPMPSAANVGAEPALGNPAATGYVLSSTDAGVRSWIAPSAGAGDVTGPATTTQYKIPHWDATQKKLTDGTALTDGQLIVGQTGAAPLPKTVSGDATLAATGALTIGGEKVAVAKMYASATDKLFGRSTAGAGAGEEIPCTAAGRALLDDATAAAQLATLGIPGTVVQSQATAYVTYSNHSATLPNDDTVPQRTETSDITSVAITPKSATNNLLVIGLAQVYNSGAGARLAGLCLFIDGTASAVSASYAVVGASQQYPVPVIYHAAAGGTTAKTFVLGIGDSIPTTWYVNGINTGRKLGGVLTSGIVAIEYTPYTP